MAKHEANPPRLDAVTLQVLWTRLISIVNEASAALVRTSFSTLVRETYDFSVILTDEHGQGIVQPPASIPAFIGTLPATVRHFLAEFIGEIVVAVPVGSVVVIIVIGVRLEPDPLHAGVELRRDVDLIAVDGEKTGRDWIRVGHWNPSLPASARGP